MNRIWWFAESVPPYVIFIFILTLVLVLICLPICMFLYIYVEKPGILFGGKMVENFKKLKFAKGHYAVGAQQSILPSD